jgi:hypothetical protein
MNNIYFWGVYILNNKIINIILNEYCVFEFLLKIENIYIYIYICIPPLFNKKINYLKILNIQINIFDINYHS